MYSLYLNSLKSICFRLRRAVPVSYTHLDVYKRQDEKEAMDFIENVAFATVGDVMPLTGENRILVKAGLKLSLIHI